MSEVVAKFALGQKVIVRNVGSVYSSYADMAAIMELDNWERGHIPAEMSQVVVVAALPHPVFADHGILYGVVGVDGNYSCVVGEDGLIATAEAVHLKADWSFGGPFTDRPTVKALALLLGYKLPDGAINHEHWNHIATSHWHLGEVTYSHFARANHFDDLGDLVRWLLDDKAELREQLAQKLLEVEQLQAQIAA